MATEDADRNTEISGLLGSLETLKDLCLVQGSTVPSCAATDKTMELWVLPLTCNNNTVCASYQGQSWLPVAPAQPQWTLILMGE